MDSRILHPSCFLSSHWLLLSLFQGFLLISFTTNYRSALGLSPLTLLSLHSLFCQYHLFHNFKNHFSIDNSQKNIFILDFFSQSRTSPLSYLIGFSNLASPKSHSYSSKYAFQQGFSVSVTDSATLPCAQAKISGVDLLHSLLTCFQSITNYCSLYL